MMPRGHFSRVQMNKLLAACSIVLVVIFFYILVNQMGWSHDYSHIASTRESNLKYNEWPSFDGYVAKSLSFVSNKMPFTWFHFSLSLVSSSNF